ncbi:MAG TPA: helicase, partial [Verrucomicrobiota bacterium]|nr:helicase [Verrucomicrobiota bacterium]
MPNIVYFDLETQKSADEVGGWGRIRDMKMSVGVTYSTARGGYAIYGERRVQELIAELQRADLVVGFNVLGFDYTVLESYHALFHGGSLPTLDLMM